MVVALPPSLVVFVLSVCASKAMHFKSQETEAYELILKHFFTALTRDGLIYQPRRGRYSFAVPLLGKFILRQEIEQQREKQLALL